MNSTVIGKTLGERRRSLLGWCLGVIASTVALASLWPTLNDMADLEQLLASYPKELGELFNIQAMTTPVGYLNAEYFSLLSPILFLTFGIGLGARLPASEEEGGSLDVLLALPITRARVLAEQAVALVLAVAALGLAQLVGLLISSALFGMDLALSAVVAASTAMAVLGALFGLVALAVGGATGRHVVALATSSVLAVASYLLYVAAQFVTAVEPWAVLSPIEHLVGSQPILYGLPALASTTLATIALVVVAACAVRFTRRDLAAE